MAQSLGVGVDVDIRYILYAGVEHVVDGIVAAAAYTDSLYDYRLVGLFERLVGEFRRIVETRFIF